MLITRNARYPELRSLNELNALPNRLARLLNLPMSAAPAVFEPSAFAPALDVADFDDHIAITAELPGLMKDDITVEIDDGLLLVRGEKKERKEERTERMYLLERSYGMFERSFALPRDLDTTKITAEFENGVLSIAIPKLKAKNGKTVAITEK